MMSEHTPVRSSNISSIAYDPERQVLEVAFTSGSRYQYAGVPATTVEQLRGAASPGGFFASQIRSAYTGVRV